jgi:enoyl-[acyl-carrier protein] reductase I
MLHWQEANSPLRRNVSTDDVGNSATYLLSDLAAGVTGEIHYVDAGYNIVGMKLLDVKQDASAE